MSSQQNKQDAAERQFRAHIRAAIKKEIKKGTESRAMYKKVAEEHKAKVWHWIDDETSGDKWLGVKWWDRYKKLSTLNKKRKKTATDNKEIDDLN